MIQRTEGHRRSIRLRDYDYSQAGAYFITIVTDRRKSLFGDIADGEMRLNDAGRMTRDCWLEIPNHFANVIVDEFVVMPNHIHGILMLLCTVGANDYSPLQSPDPICAKYRSAFRSPSKTIGSVVRGFKIGVTKWFRAHTNIVTVWQRNYYEHVVRSEDSLSEIRIYIADNPGKWVEDRENPAARIPKEKYPWDT